MIQRYNQSYNIYFGTIGKTLKVKYQYTKSFKNEEEALSHAKESATALFYKNEGKFGIPSFLDISKESDLSGVDIETLYKEHIKDLIRYYAIPTSLDSIPKRKIKY